VLYAVELVHESTDRQPANSFPPEQHSSVDSTEGLSLAEVVELPTPLTKKRRWARYSRHSVFKRRRRVACLVLGLLLLVAAGGVLLFSNPEWVGSEPVQRILSPAVGEAPKMVEEEAAESEASEGETASEEAAEEEEGTPVPDDPTLHVTVPRLGLYGHTVRNDDSEEALDQGAIKLPYTGFPWQEEDTNTYIACHRLGWSGTESYNQCLNLPSMQEGDKIFLEDANDTVYAYRVVETLTVEPEDTWVAGAVAGEDMVSLQTCVETLDDLSTLGPDWAARFVVRAERVEEGEAGAFRKIVEDPVAAYAGLLLHTPYLASYYDGTLKSAERIAVLLGNTITVFTTEALLDLERLTLLSTLPYPFV
jgi:sortase A